MEALFALFGAMLGGGLAWTAFRNRSMHTVSRSQYDEVVKERVAIATRLESAQETLENVQRELTAYRERAVTAEAENKALSTRLSEQQEQLRLEFSNMANAMLENMGKKFSTQSEEKLGMLLHPVQQRLNEFKELVTKSFIDHGKEQHTLKAEIEKIVLQADSLTRALRGDVKAQGNWGEIMLERILEESGLRAGEDYIVQGADMKLTGTDGNRLQPDVIVRLPDKKHIIVDSKVSLVDYERFCGEIDDTARALHIKNFLKSVRNHVTGLEQKKYQNIDSLGTPDLVLLFMPTEGSFSFAMQHDPELHTFAWNKKINIVSPTTLFSNLRTIASLWSIERQNRHAQEIARQAGALYDKFAGFIEDMQGIDRHIKRLHESYDQAMNKLSSGRGNLITSVEKLKALGVKSSKSLPVGEAEETALIEAEKVA